MMMEDADIQQHDSGDEMAHASVIPTSLHQHDAGDDSIHQSPPSSRKKTPKVKFAPPSNELIFGHHENDVLLGRGASTNIHPGNVAFRATCALRKQDFDAATNAQKRDIAIETVQSVLALDPPGRFLERVDGEIIINQDGTASFDGDGWEDNDVDVHSLMSPNNVKYLNELGWAQNKNSKHWKRALGPWRDVGMEKSIQKACAVIRDHKRQDRIALKAMGMLKKGSNKMTGMGVHPNNEAHESAQLENEGGIIATNNDIIIGRGAFINKHPGNLRFRELCYEKKELFDSSSAGDKRICASEILDTVKRMEGRFLKRDPSALQAPIPTGDGNYRLPPRGLEGPWEEVSDDKAFAKTIQVLRDLKVRPHMPQPMEMHQMAALPHADAGMIHHEEYDEQSHHDHLQEPDATEMDVMQQGDPNMTMI